MIDVDERKRMSEMYDIPLDRVELIADNASSDNDFYDMIEEESIR